MATEIMGQGMTKLPLNQIVCGDCLEIMADWRDKCVDLVLTDPPYGIGWKRSLNRARNSKAHAGIKGDKDTFIRDAALAFFPKTPAIVFGSFYAPFPQRLKQVLVWKKPPDAGLVGATTGYRRDVEPVFLVGPWPHRIVAWSGLLRSLKGMSATAAETGHPHTKPLDLVIELLGRTDGDLILDPFCGSGTTCVAAKMLGRKYIGIDINEKYCDIARLRLAAVETGVPVKEAKAGQLALFASDEIRTKPALSEAEVRYDQ